LTKRSEIYSICSAHTLQENEVIGRQGKCTMVMSS